MPEQCRRKARELDGQIVALLNHASRPLSAYDMVRNLQSAKPITPTIVFRALARLLNDHAICRIETRSAYMMAPSQPGILMLCETCGDCVVGPNSDVIEALNTLAVKAGFRPSAHIVEVRGMCRICAASLNDQTLKTTDEKRLQFNHLFR